MTRSNSVSHATVTRHFRPGGLCRGTASCLPGFETVEHTGDSIRTTLDQTSNLKHLVILMGQENHLVARPALHIGRIFIPVAQLCKGRWI